MAALHLAVKSFTMGPASAALTAGWPAWDLAWAASACCTKDIRAPKCCRSASST